MGHCIDGERIYLREIEISDANENYLFWMQDEEVQRFTESRFRKYTVEDLKTYVERVNQDSGYVFLAIIDKESDKHIGNIKLGPVDRNHSFADIGLIIGDRSFWGKGYAQEAIGLVSGYAFNELNIRKLTAGVYSNNIASIKAFLKVGFKEEGVLKQHYLCEGEYVDRICLGLVREN